MTLDEFRAHTKLLPGNTELALNTSNGVMRAVEDIYWCPSGYLLVIKPGESIKEEGDLS